jgi:hypothetical protein
MSGFKAGDFLVIGTRFFIRTDGWKAATVNILITRGIDLVGGRAVISQKPSIDFRTIVKQVL